MKRILLLFVCMFPWVVSAGPASLSYDYLDVGVAVGKLSLKTVGRKFDYSNRAFGVEMSSSLDSNWYTSAAFSVSSTDDRDVDRGVIATADLNSREFMASLGYASSIAESTDVIVQLGVANASDKFSGRIAGVNANTDESDTDLYWKVGLRSLWQSYGFEWDVSASGMDDRRAYTIGGPTHLTDNVALDVNHTVVKDQSPSSKTTVSSVGVGLRVYF